MSREIVWDFNRPARVSRARLTRTHVRGFRTRCAVRSVNAPSSPPTQIGGSDGSDAFVSFSINARARASTNRPWTWRIHYMFRRVMKNASVRHFTFFFSLKSSRPSRHEFPSLFSATPPRPRANVSPFLFRDIWTTLLCPPAPKPLFTDRTVSRLSCFLAATGGLSASRAHGVHHSFW